MRSRLILFFALAALPFAAFAADKETEELLAKMRKVYSSAKSAIIVTEATMPSEVGEMDITIHTTYVRPNKIVSKITEGPEGTPRVVLLKSDGKTMVTSGPRGDLRAPYDAEKVVQNVPVNLEVINFWDWKRQLSTKEGGNMRTSTFRILQKETWKEKDWMVLEETAAQQGVFVRYFIDPETFLIHRTRVQRLEGNSLIMDVRVTKLEINPKVDESIFKIAKAPAAAQGTTVKIKGGGKKLA